MLTKAALAKAKNTEMDALYEKLESREGKFVFRLAKARHGATQDIGMLKSVRNSESAILRKPGDVMSRWKEYLDRLLNKEFARKKSPQLEATVGFIDSGHRMRRAVEFEVQGKRPRGAPKQGWRYAIKKDLAEAKVYGPSNTQEQIYADMVAPQVDRVPAGYNCTLFAYGQTGSGKTYTVGRLGERSPYKNDKTTGMIPRAVEHIFEELERPNTEEYNVRVSYLELYNEELFDLLAATPEYRERLRIFDDASQR
nr:Kinesin domain containing protein [Haemonchus contortus]